MPELAFPVVRQMNILNITIEPSSSYWETEALEHWTELPESSGRSANMSKKIKTMIGTPTETVYLS